ncbi:MAG TPA: hypothetical protein PLF77_04800 [Smithella sp.]|nr:hypothetical protein [Smithella sp.]
MNHNEIIERKIFLKRQLIVIIKKEIKKLEGSLKHIGEEDDRRSMDQNNNVNV